MKQYLYPILFLVAVTLWIIIVSCINWTIGFLGGIVALGAAWVISALK